MRGAILAGGGATRFGGAPKGLSLVGGRRIIDRLADAMREALHCAPLLVANAPDAADWGTGLEIATDVVPDAGALGGILTAVEVTPAPVVCVAWDMPFVTTALITLLADALEGSDVAIPASDGPRGLEPLAAAYGPETGPAIRRALARGDRRAIAFHPEVRVRIVTAPELRAIHLHDDPFFNVNTRDDLADAEARWVRG